MPDTDSEIVLIDRKVVFVCEDHSITGQDVIDAAHFRGELEPEWKNLLRLLAAERRADEQNLEFDDDAIDAAAEQFRYQHDLITAEETEQWLAGRGLSLGDFSGFLCGITGATNGTTSPRTSSTTSARLTKLANCSWTS